MSKNKPQSRLFKKLHGTTRRHSKLTPTYTVQVTAKQYRRSVTVVSSPAERYSSCGQPEQNMLPHAFLTELQRRGKSERGRGEGGRGGQETGVRLAKEKERVREQETQALLLMLFLLWQRLDILTFSSSLWKVPQRW